MDGVRGAAEPSWSAEDLSALERMLAALRAAGALILLVVVATMEPTPAMAAVVAYNAYAAVVFGLTASGRAPTLQFQMLTQFADLAAAIAFALVWPLPDATELLLCAYTLVAASLRWGGFACVLVAACVLLGDLARGGWDARFASLAVLSAALTYVGYVGRARRTQTLALARLDACVRIEHGFEGSLRAVLTHLCRLFDARGAQVLVRDGSTAAAFLWRLDATAASGDLRCIGIRNGDRLEPDPLPNGLVETDEWKAPFVTSEWAGEVVLVQPATGRHDDRRRIALFRRAVHEIAPALHDVYRAARVRSRAVAGERVRLSRYLHDHTIQSLIGTEMRLEALSHRCRGTGIEAVTTELRLLRGHVRREILDLRDLMLRLKPVDVTSAELPGLLRDIAGRFAHDTGVDVTLSNGDLSSITLDRRMCAEIARVVQEALTNVRKHSRASRAFVRIEPTSTGIRLEVEDNGIGFDFGGRAQLVSAREPHVAAASAGDRQPVGPAALGPLSWILTALRESVRALGGELVVHSSRGRGARLEVSIPVSMDRTARIAS